MKYRGKDRSRGAVDRDIDGDTEDAKPGTCCGLRWKPLFFLVLFVGPAILGGVLSVSEWLVSVSGIQLPHFLQTQPTGPDHRARLLAFYRKNNPGKIGEVDELLAKYKGKENKLFRKLEQKYKTFS